MPAYVLDTNIFIEAHRASYPMDVFPTYWVKIKGLAEAGVICSIDKVKHELYQNDDALKDWCKQYMSDAFFQDSTTALGEYSQIVKWAYSKLNIPYTQSALDIFMEAEEADAFLAAFAKKHQLTLVTNEVSAPDSKRSVKLPDVCDTFGISVISPLQMLRNLKITI